MILIFPTSSAVLLSCSGKRLRYLECSKFIIYSSQGDAFNQDVKKASCGLKYMSKGFCSDVTYDIISEKFSTSAVVAVSDETIGSNYLME